MEVLSSYIFDAGWLLLITCVLILIAATWLAFGRDTGH
jgi:hypothetical protein